MASNFDLDDLIVKFKNLGDIPQKSLFTTINVKKNISVVSDILKSLAEKNIDDYLEVLNKGIPYELKNLERFSTEYININSSYQQTLNSQKDRWTIQRIAKALCPYLFTAYLLMQQKKMKNQATANPTSLYHGTDPNNISSICHTNFNWRLQGTSRGHMYGRGISFARRSTYACHYPSVCRETTRTLILAQVLVGKTTLGSALVTVPPINFDATAKANLDVIVKYDDAEYFPEFVIYYSSKIPGDFLFV